MFKNSQKIAISKHFLISLLFVVLLFTSFGVSMDDTYAADLNHNVSEIESGLNVEDKLGNSREDLYSVNMQEISSLGASQNNAVLAKQLDLLEGGTFNDIRKKMRSAVDGDTIRLEGTFKASNNYDQIYINKRLTFTSNSGATLDANGLCHIFVVNTTAAGSTFNNLKFINGYRSGAGSALHVKTQNVNVTNCVFEKNTALDGGAIYTENKDPKISANLLVKNCKFINNHALKSAAALAAFGNNSRIINCTFDSNGAYNYNNNVQNPFGGAIQIGLDEFPVKGYVHDCKFYNNFVYPLSDYAHGGAGCVRSGVEYKNCIFVNNSAGQGGALTFHGSGLIKNCTFINNTAYFYGGALSTGYLYDKMDLAVEDCTFDGNKAPIGGAIQVNGLNVNIKDCDFNYNNASRTGGAININAVNVNIDDVRFKGNIAEIDGGAVFIKGNKTLIKDSSFISNKAMPDKDKLDDGLGGAIYINSTKADIENNEFKFNTARNGSAIYYDKYGTGLKLTSNVFSQNQAWVYALPIYAKNIYYGQSEEIRSIIHGGNNIAKYGDLNISNAIYNAANNNSIEIDGENPVLGATTNGHLYQDDREYNMDILLTVVHEDGDVVYNKTLNSNCFGEVKDYLDNLKVGKYFVSAKHFEDTYYKAIANTTTFTVTAQVDDKVRKLVTPEEINYEDVVVWTLTIVNNGPSNATGVVVRDVLPEGLIYLEDDAGGKYDNKTGTLTFDFLEVGKTIVVNIKTKVNKTGNIVNKVNITAKEYDYNLTNNYDQADINVNPACDLAVEKTINASVVNLNDLVCWTVKVSNNGPDNATGVVVSDLLPESLIFVKSDGDYDEKSGKWNIGNLTNGGVVRLNIVCRVNATGLIENEASVKGNEHDYDKTNNYDSEILKVKSASDLAIVKLVSPSVVNYTDVVKWTLIVSNYGPDNATGVVISDVLPNGFVFLNSTKEYKNNQISVGNLTVGESCSVDIYCRVNVTGSFVNVASVKGLEFDPNLSNNKDDALVVVKPASDLAVEKLVNNSSPNFGDSVKWTIIVSNNGPDDASGVVVSDLLPESLIFVKSDGDYDEKSGKWNIGNLTNGGVVRLNIVCRVNATGLIENKVSVKGNEFDYNKSNNFDDEVIEVDAASDLAIVKLVSPSVVNYTDVVKWTLIVSNYGPDNATGVVISDVLPKGFIYLNSTKEYKNNQISVGNLTVGESCSVDIYCRVNVTGSFVNVASVKGLEFDPNLSNNKDDALVVVKPASDLAVEKLVNNSSPNFGDSVKWTIIVSNNGPDDASGVVVSDLLPESLIFVKSDGDYDEISGKWNIGNLTNGGIASLNIICRVNATGLFVNNVSVSANEFDYNKSNNKDSEAINVSKASDLSVIKLVNVSDVNYHDLVKWTIIASNNGPDNATGVTVDDILPEGLVLLNYTASKGFYDNGVWSVCCMEKGTTQTLELICYVNKTGDFTNIAKIEGEEYDPDESNNEDNASIFVPKSSDLAIIKSVDNTYPNFGDVVEWSVVVTNNGPDDAIDITIIDILPNGLKFINYTSTAGGYYEGIWYLDQLNNGCSESIIIRCLVNTLDDIINVAEVIPSQYDWNTSNNKDNESIGVNPIADLSIVKLVNVSQANYLDLVKWSLIVYNNGPNDATGVMVSDTIPNGLSIVGVEGDGKYADSIWNVGDLKNGQSKQLDIICKIIETGEFTNVANVWGDQSDPNLNNNEDENYLTVGPASDISITKTVSKYVYTVGDVVNYSIRLTNNGPDVARNVEVNEIMDDSLTFKSFKASAGDFNKLNNVWSLDALEVGESAFLKIKAIANSVGSLRNSVSATSDNYDPDLTNNDDEVLVNVSNPDNHDDVPDKHKKVPHNELDDFSEGILWKYKSGNPIVLIALLIVFSMGVYCGRDIFKKW